MRQYLFLGLAFLTVLGFYSALQLSAKEATDAEFQSIVFQPEMGPKSPQKASFNTRLGALPTKIGAMPTKFPDARPITLVVARQEIEKPILEPILAPAPSPPAESPPEVPAVEPTTPPPVPEPPQASPAPETPVQVEETYWTSSARAPKPRTQSTVVEMRHVAFKNGDINLYELDHEGQQVAALKKPKLKAYKGFDGSEFYNRAPLIKKHNDPLDISQCHTMWRGNSYFHSPWVLTNLFHTHNDNLLPLMDNVLDSPEAEERHIFLYPQFKKPDPPVKWVEVMWRLFDNNIHQASEVLDGKLHCFETLRWGRADTFFYTYADYTRRRYVVDELNKFIMSAYAVPSPPPAPSSSSPPRVLHFKRSWKKDRDDRFMENLDEVVSVFKEHGMTVDICCDWANMGIKDLMQQFSSHQVFMGVHGAGLTNALYAAPGGVLVEFHHEYKFQLKLFKEIADSRRLWHIDVDCRKTAKPDIGFHIPRQLASSVAQAVSSIWQGKQVTSSGKLRITRP